MIPGQASSLYQMWIWFLLISLVIPDCLFYFHNSLLWETISPYSILNTTFGLKRSPASVECDYFLPTDTFFEDLLGHWSLTPLYCFSCLWAYFIFPIKMSVTFRMLFAVLVSTVVDTLLTRVCHYIYTIWMCEGWMHAKNFFVGSTYSSWLFFVFGDNSLS